MKTNDMGFFGRKCFDNDARKEFKDKWSKMTDSEKIEFINKKMDHMDEHEDRFTVEAMDARCEKWMSLTREEKEELVREKKEAFEQRVGHFFGHHHRMHQ